jgi:hypothetical protein
MDQVNDRIDRTIEALSRNHTITSVGLHGDFGYRAQYSTSYLRLVDALLRLQNLQDIDLHHEYYFRGREIGDALSAARKLVKLKISEVVFKTIDADLHPFVNGLRNHPTLHVVHVGIEFPHQQSQRRQISTELMETFLSISQLKELELQNSGHFPGPIVDAPTFVRLVQMPNLRRLVLREAGLRDEHAAGMAHALMESGNGHLEYVDIRRHRGFHPDGNLFGQEGWDALFCLVQHDPLIQIHATSLHVPPHLGHATFRNEFQFDFLLREQDAVQQHLLKEEVNRSLRLRDAGFEDLLAAKDAPDDTAWVKVMAIVCSDIIALFHIVRANPVICDLQPASRRERKRSF